MITTVKISSAIQPRRYPTLAPTVTAFEFVIFRFGNGLLANGEAGADVTFVEAPTSAEELAQIAKSLIVPQVANIVFGGRTPELGREKFAELGFGCVLYANAALQAALKASHDVLKALKQEGSLASVADHLAGFAVRQQTVSKPQFDELERRYRGG